MTNHDLTSVPKYPHLAGFLAGHFGGYESAQAAADEECGGNIDLYVVGFLVPVFVASGRKEEEFAALEKFLEESGKFVHVRETYFEEDGNPKWTGEELAGHPDPIRLLCTIVSIWN